MSSFSRSIFDPEPSEDSSATTTTNTKVKEKQQLPNDKPWDGEESVADSVLRMVMDKYNKPLRVEGAARRQLPQPQTYSHHVQGLYDTDNKDQGESNMSSGEKAALRDKMVRSKRQKRIMNARDAALDYSLEKKYPSQPAKQPNNNNNKDKEEQEEDEFMLRPKSIAQMGLLAEERIRQARAEGHFDNLSGRGQPIPVDVNENNPFVDRTEYFLNRIVQRQGAAPPWIMMQQEVDTETTKFRTDLERSLRLYVTGADSQQITTSSMVLREWRHNNQGYFTKLVESLNGRLRSYNVMCPASVRKTRLDLEDELQDIYRRIT
ncbi:hypothetical protein INT45_005880 [Circinella minor]|uniref:DnaJ homologue subfamily C member 28 conserved domain-containing protein n=1 Tax=Circinella minor TaxID=1195481 RepID=A0A8H7RVU4_9FUNG|nr:hypothetical protein INT45_005880 [Circinella minor]